MPSTTEVIYFHEKTDVPGFNSTLLGLERVNEALAGPPRHDGTTAALKVQLPTTKPFQQPVFDVFRNWAYFPIPCPRVVGARYLRDAGKFTRNTNELPEGRRRRENSINAHVHTQPVPHPYRACVSIGCYLQSALPRHQPSGRVVNKNPSTMNVKGDGDLHALPTPPQLPTPTALPPSRT